MSYYDFDRQILTAINNVRNSMLARPFVLGGVSASGGGSGGPPGGFIGKLPQTKVTYDYSELATSAIPASGESLLDNLNHIRYRIQTLEDGASIVVSEDGSVISSDVTIIDFVGDGVSVAATTSGVTVTISGGVSGNVAYIDQVNAFTEANSFQGVDIGLGAGEITSNTIFGLDALASNTTGYKCTVIGYHALDANTEGYNLTAIGYDSLTANTVGTYNIGIGSNTLKANTEGYSNIAAGDEALVSNTIGNQNVGVGDCALYTNIEGTGNVAVGEGALYNNTGSYSVAIGQRALNLNSNGAGNIGVGKDAGWRLTTGNNNIFIGYLSGKNILQKNDASNSMALGYNAYTTESNQVVIGDSNINAITLGNGKKVTLSGNLVVVDDSYLSGTNTGDQDLNTFTGTVTISGVDSDEVFIVQSFGGSGIFSVEADGNIKLQGTSKAWEDLRIEPNVRNAGTVYTPTYEKWFDNGSGSRGVFLYSFTDEHTNEKEIHFTMQMPHQWAVTPIYIHVHWIPAVSGVSKTVQWGLEYNWAEPGAIFGNTTIITKNTNIFEDSTLSQYKHYLTAFDPISPSTSQDGLSSILIGRLFRNSSDTVNDTLTDKVGLLYVDTHYEVDSFGSNEEYVK